ncbi:MAG: TetR/AcrR family transcriptional regulator [Pseudomonadota bacterium]
MEKRRVMDPDAKRAAVLGSAEKLFASEGYERATMASVAREAGVAVGTVYRLFPDKSALLAALHRRLEDQFLAAMAEGWAAAERPRERFAPMLAAVLREAARRRAVMPLYALTSPLLTGSYQPGARMIEAIVAQYAEGVATGEFRPIAPHIVGPVAHAMVEGGLRAFMAEPTQTRLQDVERELTTLFNAAFLSQP